MGKHKQKQKAERERYPQYCVVKSYPFLADCDRSKRAKGKAA